MGFRDFCGILGCWGGFEMSECMYLKVLSPGYQTRSFALAPGSGLMCAGLQFGSVFPGSCKSVSVSKP